jgi:uncharacterized RDD family membrane protein YckC
MGDRLAATVLDGILLVSAFVVTGMAAFVKMGGIPENELSLTAAPVLRFIAVAAAAGITYFWVCEGLFGATLGKALAGVQVRAKSGTRCGLVASLVRNLLRVVDGLGVYLFGFIVAMSSNLRQRLGDHAAGTVVVERKLSRVARAGLILFWFELFGSGLAGAFLLFRHEVTTESSTVLVRPRAPESTREAIHIEFLESDGGPARPPLPYRPGDTLHMRCDISGYAKGADGRPSLLVNVLVSDPTGLPMHRPWSDSFHVQQAPGLPIYGAFNLTLPAFVSPGTYKITIWGRDYLTNNDFQVSPTFEVIGAAVAPPRGLEVRDFVLATAEHGTPRGIPVVPGGGAIYMRCNLLGMQFRGDQVSGRIALKVISPSGRVVADEPNYVNLNVAVIYHPASFWLPVKGDLRLPAVLEKGVYTEQFTMVDQFAARAIQREGRFEVR